MPVRTQGRDGEQMQNDVLLSTTSTIFAFKTLHTPGKSSA